MNKKIILLVLCIIGLLLWAIGFFFGFNYIQKGALMVSIPVAFFVFLLMGFMIFLMKRNSDPQGVDNYRLAKNTERAAIVIYTIVSLCTAIFLGHFVNVTMNEKTVVQDKVSKELGELERIFDMPEIDESAEASAQMEDIALYDPMEGSYLKWVNDQADNYQIELSSLNQDSSTVDVRVQSLTDSLLVQSGFWSLQHEVNRFLDNCYYAVDNWNWLTVSEKVSMLESNKEEWENKVEECARFCKYTQNEGYKCNSKEHYSDIAAPLTSLSAKDLSISAILLIIVLQVMILLSYITGRPKTGKDPLKYTDSNFARTYGAKKKTGSKFGNTPQKASKQQDTPSEAINLDEED